MKMETMIRAERDVVIKHLHVKPGAVISAKDLLMEFAGWSFIFCCLHIQNDENILGVVFLTTQ